VLAVACGGDEEESPKASPTTTAAETPAAGETPAKTPTATAAKTPAAGETPEKTPAGEAAELPNIPGYPGATEVFTGTFSGGGSFPIPLGDVPVQPDEFGNVQYTVYQTSDSIDDVLNFYEREFKSWEEEGSYSMEQLGQNGKIVAWTRDGRQFAAWLWVFEEEGATGVVVAVGARQ
jgi:hypothetical protein